MQKITTSMHVRSYCLYPRRKKNMNRELISIRVDNDKLKKMYVKISKIYSFIACENIVNASIHIFMCVYLRYEKRTLNERKEKTYISCAHAHVYVYLYVSLPR